MDFGLILDGFLVGFPSIFGEVSGRCFARFLIKFSTIFGLLARFLVDCSSAVAGTAALLRFGYNMPFACRAEKSKKGNQGYHFVKGSPRPWRKIKKQI